MSPEDTKATSEQSAAPKKKVGRPKGARTKNPRPPRAAANKNVYQEPTRPGQAKFSGACRWIKITSNGSANPQFPEMLPLTLGDFPRHWVRANQRVPLPEELISVLRDTATEIPAPGTIKHGEDRNNEQFVRIPWQDLGPCSWEEYVAFKKVDAVKPLVISKH